MNDKLIFDRAHGALLGVAIAEAIWANKVQDVSSELVVTKKPPLDFTAALHQARQRSTGTIVEPKDFPQTRIMMTIANSLISTEQHDISHQMKQIQQDIQGIGLNNLPVSLTTAFKRSQQTGIVLAGNEDEANADLYHLSRAVPLAIMYMASSPTVVFTAAMLNSSMTHDQDICRDAMKLMAYLLLVNMQRDDDSESSGNIFISPEFADYINAMWDDKLVPRILADYTTLSHQALPDGNGVEDKIASVLWCFCNGESPEQSLQLLYDLPQNEDDTAIALGALLGSWYGAERMRELLPSIPIWSISKRVSRSLVLLSETESEK